METGHGGRVGSGDIALFLRRRITSAGFLHGERLPPERAFAEQFGVSRGTVRDALRQLEESGFVERRPGSGTYVCYSEANQSLSIIQSTSPLELVDARFALEPQIASLAVLYATEQNLAKVESALRDMENCRSDPDLFAEGDEVFHLALAECTHNSMLVWMSRRVSEVRSHTQWAKMRRLTLTPTMIDTYNAQHRAILNAIRQRDAEAASTSMRKHLSEARRSLVQAVAS